MSIGGSRETFWHLTPKDIMIDFKAYKNRMRQQQQLAWLNGLYVKKAIESSVLICGLADKKVVRNMPNYPEFPKDYEEIESEEEIKKKREYMIAKMNYWTKINNKKFDNKNNK